VAPVVTEVKAMPAPTPDMAALLAQMAELQRQLAAAQAPAPAAPKSEAPVTPKSVKEMSPDEFAKKFGSL
jgi:hypothetical protein